MSSVELYLDDVERRLSDCGGQFFANDRLLGRRRVGSVEVVVEDFTRDRLVRIDRRPRGGSTLLARRTTE